ncbi:MAG: hypothetical protein ACJ739_10095 [Acidimicrobiales bacterium]
MDGAWDAEAGLLLNPPGSFEEVVEPRSVHLVRETAWYAVGLLLRDGPGDRSRAEQALHAVLDHQYDAPGTPWHGTFVRFPEWPEPADGAVEWVDYDPNWRQFVGTTLAVAVTDLDLPGALAQRARDAVHLAVESEPPDRVPPTYANIALMRAWLDAWAQRADDGYAAAVVDAFGEHGAFLEYGSPTYYGVDLLALALWQRADSPVSLQRDGAALESALWTDVARWWHAGLGNLCGPYSRAYGMDGHRYVSGLSLAIRCAGMPAPLPDLEAAEVVHGHDLCKAPLLEHLGLRPPTAVRPAFERFGSRRSVHQVISASPRREASAWLEEGLMVGAEHGDTDLQARGQFHPATAHWRQPDGSVGWLRVEHHGPTRARAEERRLLVDAQAHPRRGARPVRWISNIVPVEASARRWRFPGLEVEVQTPARLVDEASLTYDYEGGGTVMELRLHPVG